ncbi:Predicted transcriptional regulator of cysteine synthase, Rrf2 family [hydrothermal vent metagenome]|uniref:Predicted transcriptional regulator of cysteine synthase, Rrf2 family n=1 Tax=hydrothermal vent metagenome TaxID=652676 RepID=A0A1W1EDG5_9ZZZZ
MIGISSKTIYAIASLHELASIPKDEVLKIKEIASRANVPHNFLEQILLELRKKGLLISIKGAKGGYRLAKELKDITLKDIVLILETDAFSDICRTDNPALKLFWSDIKSGVSSVFDVPLSELNNYQNKANKILNYSI